MGQIKNIKLHIVTDIKSKKEFDEQVMAATRAPSRFSKHINALREWYVYKAGYRQMGLRREDLFMARKSEDMDEAFNRLPEEEANLRIFRIKRAADLSLKHAILPKEQWTKPEEDVIYLSDVVKQVKKEREERERYDQL